MKGYPTNPLGGYTKETKESTYTRLVAEVLPQQDPYKKILKVKRTKIIYLALREYDRRGQAVGLISTRKLEEKDEEESFTLELLMKDEILEKKKNVKSGMLLVQNGLYFFGEIPENLSLMASDFFGEHICPECAHFSAAPIEEGGCPKVRNYPRRIERYSWITKGYEVFKSRFPLFVVCECKNFERYEKKKPEKKPPPTEKKLNLIKLDD